MHPAKTVSTPMNTSVKLFKLNGVTFEDTHFYRIVVGSLQYISFTRPNIFYAINRFCQFMHSSKFFTGKQCNEFFIILNILKILVFSLLSTLLLLSLSSLILIRLGVEIIKILYEIFVSIQAHTLYFGTPRSSQLLLSPPLWLSTRPLLMLLMRLFRCNHC